MIKTVAAALALLFLSPAYAQDLAPSRGSLLYNTHCIACHTAQLHWRDRKIAANLTGLQFQVRRWQANIGLSWPEADIAEVSRYLNELYYRYEIPDESRGRLKPAAYKH